MRRIPATALTLTLVLSAVASHEPAAPLEQGAREARAGDETSPDDSRAQSLAHCVCELAKKQGGWCRECRVGYVASIEIPSPMLFEALDAHGHAIVPDLLRCEMCRRAAETDGFCDRSRIGFVRKQAFLSRLAYYAARGEVLDPSGIQCSTCRKNAADYGWCRSCGIGMVGGLALRTRADLKEARKAVEILRRVLRRLDACETCAVATVTGGRCPLCRISYRDGTPGVRPTAPIEGGVHSMGSGSGSQGRGREK